MSGSKSRNVTWQEEDVEAVLRDFLHAEMPAELRGLPSPALTASANSSESPDESRSARRRTGRISLAATAGALCVAFSLLLMSSPVVRPSRNTPRASTVLPVADMQPTVSAPNDKSQLANDTILNSHRSWYPAVIPVELRKFAPGLLIQSGVLKPESEPDWGYPEIEVLPLPPPDEDDEGMTNSPDGSKPAKKD